MNTIEQKFRKEIDSERMWVACKQGGYVFFSLLPLSCILIAALWDSASHQLLLVWLFILTAINFFRWFPLRFYHNHKEALTDHALQIKRVIFLGSLLTGSWWAVSFVWFLEPSQPLNVLIMSFFIMILGVGTVMSWFCYLPAVMAILLPSVGTFALLLFLHGSKTNITISLTTILLIFLAIAHSIKLSRMLNQTLLMNFENVSLRQETEEKSALLNTALEEAKQANAAKTRFLAAASHDLRQPIHALGLFFGELSDRVYSPETATVIGQVEDSIDAINSMLNALLDVSKLDAGVVRPAIETVALSELFARLQVEFQPIALENHNELRIRPTLAMVNSDPAMLERILRNLIGNALRYTENGRVLVAARRRRQHIEIQVWDNGTGIPEDQLDEIFIEFHQLQNPARDRRQGLGLGLAIVKRLANLLHHEIKVVSRLGSGSCFSISLLLAHITTEFGTRQMIVKAQLTNDLLAGRQVLVLDDDNAVLEGMQGLLNRWGCHVTAANSPAEAMEKLAANTQRLALLIIDYRLQDNASGIEVARDLQSHLGYPVAVLIITGDTGPERLQEADASGYPLLHKPVQPAKLRSTLQYLMSKLNGDASTSDSAPSTGNPLIE